MPSKLKLRKPVREDPFAVFAEKHAEIFIKKLQEENRKSFTLQEILDFLPPNPRKDILALHVAGAVIKKLGNGKFQFEFFRKFD
jgi:hypothetical protein